MKNDLKPIREALEEISRMHRQIDHVTNTITLGAAQRVAKKALANLDSIENTPRSGVPKT